MSGIRLMAGGSRNVLVPVVWVDSSEVPVIFLVVRGDFTGLAHPDHIEEVLHSVSQGELTLGDAWDKLLIKTPEMAHPKPCEIAEVLGAVTVLVDGDPVYSFNR
ncbi:hypothetical protein [Streptomyces cucumeris]|uniref:hypothetical protein n=1 Tax=Streptomyces cucumeris TaxID=2962890 RepID=UPI0020C8526C|nr:hypothetical protein [Streptomyces sp. NEAU-Y11]MCP9209580.1 hypothetical protein [Streptomyces sp. NEAU-Y11]